MPPPIASVVATALLCAACSCPPPAASPTPTPAARAHDHDEPTRHDAPTHRGHGHDAPKQGHHGHAAPHEGDAGAPLVHRFDDTDPESWAKRFESPDREAYQRPAEVVASMGITPGMVVADIGAGTGYFLPHLSQAVGDAGTVVAVDIAPNMVRHIKKRAKRDKLPNVEVRLALLDDPLLPAASIDRILIVNTWHHIAERKRYAATLAETLKPGGQVYVVDFKPTSDKGPPKMHKLAPSVVAQELADGGFETRVDDAMLAEQYLVIATKR
jgi:cyclopropane fatty-acyl-phospholipid synthase-like methyltransferase